MPHLHAIIVAALCRLTCKFVRGASPAALRECIELVEKGVIDPCVCKTWRIDEANEAIEALRDFKNISRTVFSFE